MREELDASHGPVDAALGMVLEYPSLYQGQEIAVEGDLVLTDRAGGLFASPEHARAFEPSSGVRVRPSRDMSARPCEGGHAKVSGTLEAGPEHSEPWIGTLVATHIEPTEPPN